MATGGNESDRVERLLALLSIQQPKTPREKIVQLIVAQSKLWQPVVAQHARQARSLLRVLIRPDQDHDDEQCAVRTTYSGCCPVDGTTRTNPTSTQHRRTHELAHKD